MARQSKESSSSTCINCDNLLNNSSSCDDCENDREDTDILRWLDQALQEERRAMQQALELRHTALLTSLGPKLSQVESNSSLTTFVTGKVRKHCSDDLTKLEPIPEEQLSNLDTDAPVVLLGAKTRYARFAEWVNGPVFELAFLGVIIMNAVVMALEMQYRGFDSGKATDYPGYSLHAVELWPWASKFFVIAEWAFGICFTIELLLKMVAQRRHFVHDVWNLVDCLIFAAWIFQTILQADVGINPMFLRLVRFLLLYRLLQVFSTIAVFDSLYVMMAAIRHSCSLILASLCVLILVHMYLAILLQSMLEEYVRDPTNNNTLEVYKYFGSFSRTMITMFDMTLGTWMPACQVLVENVSEWYAIFFLMHKFLIGFSVVSIITAVFIQESFQVAASDETNMLRNQERLIKLHEERMTELFKHVDEDGVGILGRAEFMKIVSNPVVIRWLASIGLQKEDAGLVLDTLASFSGKQEVTASELVRGAARLKGSARHIDVLALVTYYKQSHNLLQQISEQLMYPEEGEEEEGEDAPIWPPMHPSPKLFLGEPSLEIASQKIVGTNKCHTSAFSPATTGPAIDYDLDCIQDVCQREPCTSLTEDRGLATCENDKQQWA